MPYIPKQYDSATAFLGGYGDLGNIVDNTDSKRCSVYSLYDDFYHNRPETFRVTLRGDSDIEIYLPSTKKIIDATARFLAVDFDFTVKGGAQEQIDAFLRNLFKREEIQKKFIQSKKSNLVRGDSVWHITADPSKQRGERISIHTVHPSSYFPIEDPDNSERIIGVHLVDLVQDPREPKDRTKKVARRQTYRKERVNTAGEGGISSETRLFEIGFWDDRYLDRDELKPVSTVMTRKMLPQAITQLPVYHLPNNPPDGSSWGTSQVSGVEYLINALNQSITYEDLSLMLQGLGVYVSTAGPPIDPTTGRQGKYKLHPGNVVEIAQGDTFERVTGVTSTSPYQEHMTFIDKYMGDGLGIPDMAQGSVDVAVAQSGIALALKMGPILAENEDKQLAIAGKWDQIFYDLVHGWMPAFEQLNSPASVVETVFGDPMPINREAKVNEIIQLKTAGLLLADECRQEMEKLGYQYDPGIAEQLLEEQTQQAIASAGEPFMSEFGAAAGDLTDQYGSSVSASTNGSSE